MTPAERSKPKLLNASRKKRIARGAGVQVQDINRLLKMHRQMADMMKKMGKKGMKGLFGGGMPDMGDMAGMDPAQLPDMSKLTGQSPGVGGGLPPGLVPKGMGGLPGLGGPGLPGTKKK